MLQTGSRTISGTEKILMARATKVVAQTAVKSRQLAIALSMVAAMATVLAYSLVQLLDFALILGRGDEVPTNELVAMSFLALLGFSGLFYFLSERFWLKLFKINELLSQVQKS